MWIFLNNAFLSIVDPDGAYDGRDGPVGTRLLVRGRFKGDIERIFPRAKVTETPSRDYRYRAMIAREEVAKALAEAVMQNGAKNFKGSTKERWRHDTYMRCWTVMEAEQRRRAPRSKGSFDDYGWGLPNFPDRT